MWTLILFLRADRLVNTYGDWPGYGPMTLLNVPALGFTVTLPSGGAVPLAATSAAGDWLHGVSAGMPWDTPFFGQ